VVEDVIGDLHDGTILAELLEILTGKTCFDCQFFMSILCSITRNVLYSLQLLVLFFLQQVIKWES
jgi:hypothetical protein